MKKILSVFVIISAVFSLASCGYEVKYVRKDYDPEFEYTMEWAKEHFNSIAEDEYFFSERTDDSIKYYGAKFSVNSADSVRINGKEFPFPPDSAALRSFGYEFFASEEYREGMYDTRYTTGYLQSENGSRLDMNLVTTKENTDIRIENFTIRNICLYFYDENGEKAENRTKFKINGAITGDSSIEDVLNELGYPEFFNVEKHSDRFSVTLDYAGNSLCTKDAKFVFTVNEKGSYLNQIDFIVDPTA